MPHKITVVEHHSIEELEALLDSMKEVRDWLRVRAVLLARRGLLSPEIATQTGRERTWVFETIKAYNEKGEVALFDGRRNNAKPRLVNKETEVALLEAVQHEEPPGGGLWTRGETQRWLKEERGIEVSEATAYRTMRRAGMSVQTPRPANEQADKEAQEAFKKGASNKQ